MPLQTLIGFAYQDVRNGASHTSDLIFMNNRAFFNINAFNSINAGIYTEKYINKDESAVSGWRIGPQIGFNYLRRLIFRAEYRMLIHLSDVITQFSHEHWIRLLAGKMLTAKWSLFLLADINFRNIFTEDNKPFAYSVVDSENHVYLKLAYEPNQSTEFSFKSGYFKENYFINDALLEGWNFTFGITIKK